MKHKSITIEDFAINKLQIIKEWTKGDKKVIFKNNCPIVDLNTRIARYTSLYSLIDLLYYKRLFVQNRLNFDDLRETKGLSRSKESLPHIRMAESYKTRLWWNNIEKDRRRFLQTCVSCWTMGIKNGEGIEESYLMWKAYANGSVGCRLETSIENFMNSIEETPSDIIIEDVVYGDCNMLKGAEQLIFHKESCYKQEEELRIVVLSNNNKGEYLKLDLDKLFGDKTDKFKITLSPFAPPSWYYFVLSNIKDACNKYPGIEFSMSNIIEYKYLTPEDKKALELFKDYK